MEVDQPADPDDAALDDVVRRARAGDPEALEDLLARLRPLVLRRCARLLPYHADAEDAAQDALLAIATGLPSYAGTGSFRGWVTVIASNAARSTYRSMRRRFVETSDAEIPEAVDPRTTSIIAGSRLALLDALEELERQHPATVQAFVLRDLGTLPYAEIAAQLGVPLGTVKARVHHARTSVRASVGESWTHDARNL